MHKTLIELPWLHLSSYDAMMLLAYVAATGVALLLAPRFGVSRRQTVELTTLLLAVGWFGSKITAQLVSWDRYVAPCLDPASVGLTERDCGPLLRFWEAGLVWYGGVIPAFGACAVYARVRGHRFRDLSDLAMAPLALGHVFGRIGCYLTGCCFGRVCDGFPAVRFPLDSPPARFHEAQWPELEGHLAASLPVHPTQLYEATGELLLFAGLMVLSRRRRYGGQMALVYLAVYGTMRFLIETLRGDSFRGFLTTWDTTERIGGIAFTEVTGLSTSQAIAIPVVLAAVAGLVALRRRVEPGLRGIRAAAEGS